MSGVVEFAGTLTKVTSTWVLESTVGFSGLLEGVPSKTPVLPLISANITSILSKIESPEFKVTIVVAIIL